jgi:hypothetical protein
MNGIVVGKDAVMQRQKGDIIATFQYVQGEAAMILSPLRPKPGGGIFVICESAIPRYLQDSYVFSKACEAANVMGMDSTKATITRICDIIFSYIPFLVEMPPKPDELKRVVDEAIVSVNGKERLAQRFV